MRQFETSDGGLPIVTGNGPRGEGSRASPRAAFLSQLIAERHHLSTQRVKRRAPVADALRSYDAGGKISVRRLPPGYRMHVDI